MESRVKKKKPSWFELCFHIGIFALVLRGMLLFLAKQMWAESLIAAFFSFLFFSIVVDTYQLIAGKKTEWQLKNEELEIRIGLSHLYGYGKEEAEKLIIRYIDNIHRTNNGLNDNPHTWAQRLHKAKEEKMTKEQWGLFVMTLKKYALKEEIARTNQTKPDSRKETPQFIAGKGRLENEGNKAVRINKQRTENQKMKTLFIMCFLFAMFGLFAVITWRFIGEGQWAEAVISSFFVWLFGSVFFSYVGDECGRTEKWVLDENEKLIVSFLSGRYEYSQSEASELLVRYIDSFKETNKGLRYEEAIWAKHLHKAVKEEMSKQQWEDYVEFLRQNITENQKKWHATIDKQCLAWEEKELFIKQENQKKGFKPHWTAKAIKNYFAFALLFFYGTIIVAGLSLPDDVFDDRASNCWLLSTTGVLLTVLPIWFRARYIKWYEKKHKRYYENKMESQNLRVQVWVLESMKVNEKIEW